ncbi:phosphoribosylanthranilate isomerase [Hyphomonas sp.]|uniref:phosphoribosylanthranilate isomerase n=1 Tax=Hyphomonas sp. TaxID=87 RepID=UPI00391CCBE3
MAEVKICGIRDADMVSFAAREGAGWIGINFIEISPRFVPFEAAGELIAAMGPAQAVALLADPADEAVRAAAALGFPVIQLHGQETPERVSAIREMSGLEVWKAVGVRTRAHLAGAEAFKAADRLLIDARAPEGSAQAGGHGNAFDWAILEGWTAPKPWLLAGGLTPENVARAILDTGAAAVDVSSGVERERGVKDKERVRAFIRAAKGL